MMRKRIFAVPSPGLDAIHPGKDWHIVIRVYQKLDVHCLPSSRRIMCIIIMDKEGKMMFAVMKNEQIDRLDTSLIEGGVYYLEHVHVRPIAGESEILEHPFECIFRVETVVNRLMYVGEMPRFPGLVPFANVFNRIGRPTLVDVVGVVMSCSRMARGDNDDGRVTEVVRLLDERLQFLTLSVSENFVMDHIQNWWRCKPYTTVIDATMLRVNADIVRTTQLSRLYFNPDIDEAMNLITRFTDLRRFLEPSSLKHPCP